MLHDMRQTRFKDQLNILIYCKYSGCNIVTFPVGRIHRLLKSRVTAQGRVGATTAVYSAAILDFPCCLVVFSPDRKPQQRAGILEHALLISTTTITHRLQSYYKTTELAATHKLVEGGWGWRRLVGGAAAPQLRRNELPATHKRSRETPARKAAGRRNLEGGGVRNLEGGEEVDLIFG
ncbi:unnamed protein product [Fraxinus pennsylvanica]|uniref:Uncharacterized protein n=1 Tax=Fraxinus pennsylvanica TaxID=56036 RepID=A0AAD1ZYC3_9LAMI|nr:unnamed protein product [Fraxinus pennsylvanica]